ncbi:MAG: ferritin family protein [Nitrospirae bacterium]|nr:ferritin family protein [Nitrospirota bacterium]
MATSIKTVKRALLSEVKSRAFYRLATTLTDRDDSRVLFMELADLEVDHARDLARRVSEPPLNLDFDAFAYVEKLEERVSGVISPEDEKTVRKGDSKEILKLARRREAEARDSYRDLATETDDPSMRAFFEDLSRLEQGHLDEIKRLELALTIPEAERPSL